MNHLTFDQGYLVEPDLHDSTLVAFNRGEDGSLRMTFKLENSLVDLIFGASKRAKLCGSGIAIDLIVSVVKAYEAIAKASDFEEMSSEERSLFFTRYSQYLPGGGWLLQFVVNYGDIVCVFGKNDLEDVQWTEEFIPRG
jgi:hypothetical protein